MHQQILTVKQSELLPYIQTFSKRFYLAGGTAIALHIGHRHSIDFDLFMDKPLKKTEIWKRLDQFPYKSRLLSEDIDQLHVLINNVKVTFRSYPYPIDPTNEFNSNIKLPTLLTLASMKAFALGRRAKWKDYVDMYFILKDHYSINEISAEAKRYFIGQFSEKLFREQLAFHKDIDYSEPVDFLIESPPSDDEIKQFLIDKALDLQS